MAQESEKSHKPELALPALAVLVLLALGIQLTRPPLQTSRPEESGDLFPAAGDQQIIPARLWQDPLAAVEGKPSWCVESIDLDEDTGKEGDILIQPVLISGEPYWEDREQRLRTRYAVLSSLYVAGYVPTDSTHIGCCCVGKCMESVGSCRKEDCCPVPFEAFHPDRLLSPEAQDRSRPNPLYKRVLVLWINERYLEGNTLALAAGDQHDQPDETPIRNLRALLDRAGLFTGCVGNQRTLQTADDHRVDIKAVGPSMSDLLVSMLVEANGGSARKKDSGDKPAPEEKPAPGDKAAPEEEPAPDGKIDPRLEIYSSHATISNDALTALVEAKTGKPDCRIPGYQEKGKALYEAGNLVVIRTIATDESLARIVGYELDLRGVHPLEAQADREEPRKRKERNKEFCVALIAEWDTSYGRAMLDVFNKTLNHKGYRVGRFTYLRGIDGRLPETRGAEEGRSAKPGQDRRPNDHDKDKAAREAALEQPCGPAQLDYLRRLEEQIKGWGSEEPETQRKIKAIGVLGSDVYDKILLLKALRKGFPGAFLFTTDLDARLYHPDEYPHTRNLLVASHFDTRVKGTGEAKVPPFRNSYQTSTFLTCLKVLGYTDMAPTQEEENNKPGIYEIGSKGPVALTRFTLTDKGGAKPDACRAPQPCRKPAEGFWRPWILAYLLLLVLLFVANPKAWRDRRRRIVWFLLFLVVIPGLAKGAEVVVRKVQWDPQEEPFALAEGISAWPTNGLRVMAGFFGLCCLFAARGGLRRIGEAFQKDYHFDARGTGGDEERPGVDLKESPSADRGSPGSSISSRSWTIAGVARRGWAWGRRRWRELWFYSRDFPEPVDPARLWQGYFQGVMGWASGLRPLLLCLLYYICMSGLFSRYPTYAPLRGPFTQAASFWLLHFTVLIITLLLFYVLDQTNACIYFIRNIVEKRLRWQDDRVLRDFRENKGMTDPEDLREWVGVKIVARLTDVVGQFIYYPFLVVVIMALSRASIFDQWDWPVSLILVLAFFLALTAASALALRRWAERARRKALEAMGDRVLRAYGSHEQGRAQQLQRLLEEIRDERGGAFSPFSQNPVLRAFLIALSGIGSIPLLERLLAMP